MTTPPLTEKQLKFLCNGSALIAEALDIGIDDVLEGALRDSGTITKEQLDAAYQYLASL